MSRGPESRFWKKVRSAWPGHAVRIEASDGEVDPGTPDTVLSVAYRGGFVELKVWPDNVSSIQLAWHMDAIERGAYCMVLCELPSGKVWLGDAEEFERMMSIREVKRPPEGVSLQSALDVIRCALTGTRRRK